MQKPFHQKLITWIGWLLTGVVTVGTFLDAVGNVLGLITRPVTYLATATIWLSWIFAQVLLRNRPIDWITSDGLRIHIKRLGVGSTLPLAGATMLLWVPVLSAPKLSLTCPKTIDMNVATIAGTAPPSSRIALYIRPIDGSSEYWLEGNGKITVSKDGKWRHLTRFGNPYGIGHKVPWPAFDVYAVALEGSASPPSEKEFSPNARAVHCSVKREPEPAIACKAQMLNILSPQPLSCPFAAQILVDPSCDPQEIATVRSPVVFAWKPEIEVFAELYRDGRPVTSLPKQFDGKFGSGNPLESGLAVPLRPGEYQFKIAKHKGAPCKTSSWFRVVSR